MIQETIEMITTTRTLQKILSFGFVIFSLIFSVISLQDGQNVAANCSSIDNGKSGERKNNKQNVGNSEMENFRIQERWIGKIRGSPRFSGEDNSGISFWFYNSKVIAVSFFSIFGYIFSVFVRESGQRICASDEDLIQR